MQANKILLLISLALLRHSKILVMDVEDLRKLVVDGDQRGLLSATENRSLEDRRLGKYWGTCTTSAGKQYEGQYDWDTGRMYVRNNYNNLRPSDGGVWVKCGNFRFG